MHNFFEDKTFEKDDLPPDLKGIEFLNCRFINCSFAGLILSKSEFADCEFLNCDLSAVNLTNVTFQNVIFRECKLQGLHFEDCNEYVFECIFDQCQLNYSSFYKRNLKHIGFNGCKIIEADFTGADLSGNNLENCDLSGTKFENTNLEKADLRTSYNFSIDPEKNRIIKAKFSRINLEGLLDKYQLQIE